MATRWPDKPAITDDRDAQRRVKIKPAEKQTNRSQGDYTDMEIKEIKENKKLFLPLLLSADEQENMIDKYIDRGTMYVLDDNGIKCECIKTVTYFYGHYFTRRNLINDIKN